ncbi:MAG: hypothetical protein GX567_14565 [Clostridia bacterium]|nr:hypothetical protein [Clostridia bacterium]
MEYGSAVIPYEYSYLFNYYLNTETAAVNYLESSESTKTNSGVIVGWDDTYPIDNFIDKPTKPGAWLIKTGDTPDWGKDGYIWVSYESESVKSQTAYVFEMADPDFYDRNYHYDGAGANISAGWSEGSSYANVYVAAGAEDGKQEILKAVGINLPYANQEFRIDIYKNLSKRNIPTSGEQVSSQQVKTGYKGYLTINLAEPVSLKAGDTYAICVTSMSDRNYIYKAKNYKCSSYQYYDQISPDTVFFKSGSTGWSKSTYTPRIKGLTKIEDVSVSENSISECVISGVKDYPYTGEAIKQQINVTLNDRTLTEGVDYQLSYENNLHAGVAVLMIQGLGTYSGCKEVTFQITPKAIKKSNTSIRQVGSPCCFFYNDGNQFPECNVSVEGTELIKEMDYQFQVVKNGIYAGESVAKIVGIGDYTGELEFSYVINKLDISLATCTITDQPVFTGKEVTVFYSYKYRNKELPRSICFSTTYSNNVNAGEKAYIDFTGIKNGEGKKRVYFTIEKRPLDEVSVHVAPCQYQDQKEVRPEVSVFYDDYKLTEGIEYDIEYENNVNVTTSDMTQAQKPTVIIQAREGEHINFKGTKKVTFDILGKSLSELEYGLLDEKEVYSSDGVTAFEPQIYVKDQSATLTQGKDYQVRYYNNVKPGAATIEINGIGTYAGTVEIPFVIQGGKELGKLSFEKIPDQIYQDGQPIRPAVTVKDATGNPLSSDSYSVVYENNSKVGKATAYVMGTGAYRGCKVLTFQIKKEKLNSDHIEVKFSAPMYSFNSLLQKPELTVKNTETGITLKENQDYKSLTQRIKMPERQKWY